jgi:hypothetical protein
VTADHHSPSARKTISHGRHAYQSGTGYLRRSYPPRKT